jgi:two-component system NtrC family sensor kinase
MSLRKQTAVLLIGLSLAFVISTYAVQVLVVMPAFAELELQGARRDVDRCFDAIKSELEEIDNTANDWGSWDDLYQYVEDQNEKFAKANLTDESFSNTHKNLICILDTKRRVVWGQAHDMVTLESIEVPDLFAILQEDESPITTHENIDDARQGILLTSRGAIMVASRPILSTKREGPIRGSVVMGRFLSEQEVSGLSARTHVSLDAWTVTQADIPAEAHRNLGGLSGGDKNKHVEVVDAKTLHAYTILRDVYGQPAVLLRVSLPRDVMLQGRVSAYMATGCSIAGGILTLLAMGFVLQCRIVGPLQSMAAHAVRVGTQDNLKARLNFQRNDEIGTLASEFDNMVQNLADTRRKVLDSAHRAGMAEIASEVLHNVGNAVNSANCSVETLEERLASSRVGGIERAAALLRDHAPRAAEFFGKDPRGPKLIDYLFSLGETLQQERIDNQSEIVRLREIVRHIRDAISAQQVFAGRSDFRQDVDLPKLVDEALQINRDLIRITGTQISLEIEPLPELLLNKSKMIQILVNLVRNALQAMQEMPSDHRRLTIAARRAEEDGIEIELVDTGTGFGEDVRGRLFTHGFTTKPEGHGFGLHFCANAIRDAGGHITAQSAGTGQGATFRIRMPNVITVVPTSVQ